MDRRSLENHLAAALAPRHAPAGLWDRVHSALETPAAQAPARRSWPRSYVMAAALAALMTGGVLYVRAQAAGPNLATVSLAVHQGDPAAPAPADGAYAVQRYTVEGHSITLVSIAVNEPGVALKQIHTTEAGGFTVSEWTGRGRRWALVSAKAAHTQACSVCHHA